MSVQDSENVEEAFEPPQQQARRCAPSATNMALVTCMICLGLNIAALPVEWASYNYTYPKGTFFVTFQAHYGLWSSREKRLTTLKPEPSWDDQYDVCSGDSDDIAYALTTFFGCQFVYAVRAFVIIAVIFNGIALLEHCRRLYQASKANKKRGQYQGVQQSGEHNEEGDVPLLDGPNMSSTVCVYVFASVRVRVHSCEHVTLRGCWMSINLGKTCNY